MTPDNTIGKCAAGFWLPIKGNCHHCGSGPEGPCWISIQQDQQTIARLRGALEDIINLNVDPEIDRIALVALSRQELGKS